MRSGLVFTASDRIPNRFLLCRVLAASARKMHRDGVSTSQCINNSLTTLGEHASEQPEDATQAAQEESSEVAAGVP